LCSCQSKSQKYADELRGRYPLPTSLPDLYPKVVNAATDYLKLAEDVRFKKALDKTPVLLLGAPDLDAESLSVSVPGSDDELVVLVGARLVMVLDIMMRTSRWLIEHNSVAERSTAVVKVGRFLADYYAFTLVKRPFADGDLPDFLPEENQNTLNGLAFCLGFLVAHEVSHILGDHLSQVRGAARSVLLIGSAAPPRRSSAELARVGRSSASPQIGLGAPPAGRRGGSRIRRRVAVLGRS
jgi:hypothetical protein